MPSDKSIEKRIGAAVNFAPQISVVVPAYNIADFIRATLDSVLTQTAQNYEIVVVNDGSPDTLKLEKVLEKYFDRIVYIKQQNGGTAAARNTGIENSRGEFLAFLDGDDIWLPAYLAAQLAALKEKNCDLIYCDAELFGALPNAAKTYMEKSPSGGAVTTGSLIGATCNVITSGTIARREKIVHAGMFDETLPRIGMEDFDLWFRLAKTGAKLDYQKKVLLKYRVRPNSLSGSNVQRAEREIVALDTIARKYKLSVFEREVFERQRARAVADLEIEKGKLSLAKGEYRAARENLIAANRYYRKLKFTVLIWLLKFSPASARRIFQKKRSAEFSFVLPDAEGDKR